MYVTTDDLMIASFVLALIRTRTKNSKVVTKQYPLSDFYPPYIPDQDRQELPNSKLIGSSARTAPSSHVIKVSSLTLRMAVHCKPHAKT